MIFFWLFLCGAHATTLTSDTTAGEGYVSQQLSTNGAFSNSLSGSASFGYARLTETGTNGSFYDETNTLSGALTWLPERLQFRLGGSGSNTAAENLTTRGLTFDGGYRGSIWKWKIGVGGMDYRESYTSSTTTKKGKLRTTTGTEGLRQKFLRADLRASPLPWLHLRSALTAFAYDRDVAKFEANLDSPASVRRGADGFGSVVGGLPANSFLLEVGFDLSEAWDVTLSHTVSRLAVGGGQRSFVTRLEFGVDLSSAWHLDFGAERDQSPTFSETLGLIGFDVTF